MMMYVDSYSVAADHAEYVVETDDKAAAERTVPPFMRWDFTVRPATPEEVNKLPHRKAE